MKPPWMWQISNVFFYFLCVKMWEWPVFANLNLVVNNLWDTSSWWSVVDIVNIIGELFTVGIICWQLDACDLNAVDGAAVPQQEPMKILHKDHDIITTFCVNQVRIPHTNATCIHFLLLTHLPSNLGIHGENLKHGVPQWWLAVVTSHELHQNLNRVAFYITNANLKASTVSINYDGHDYPVYLNN